MSFLGSIFGEKGLVGGVVDVLKSTGVINDPEMELKAKQALMDFETKVDENASKALETINSTMREEAKSEHWMQWAWRPTVGFTFSGVIVNNFILLPYLKKFGLVPIDIPGDIWTTMLVVLGVAAGTRGWEKATKK
jgi:hypothetical protein